MHSTHTIQHLPNLELQTEVVAVVECGAAHMVAKVVQEL
jgi:hypothetical protein